MKKNSWEERKKGRKDILIEQKAKKMAAKSVSRRELDQDEPLRGTMRTRKAGARGLLVAP